MQPHTESGKKARFGKWTAPPGIHIRPRAAMSHSTDAFGSLAPSVCRAGAQGHNSLPPEHVGRRLQFVDSGAEPLEFDAATLRLPTSSRQVTTPPNVDFATESWPTGDAAQRRLRH
ncbi:hypothetical protein HPB51_018151 [Rhipicephalus microplus]|uniref:Uncharacterized protein n=1 Tax=Rhipicephalus microplus TaxID=6941 RepID=A0A9J6D613_RHIMP|nr:hypothetical protein HPB51_018151 [Rhipicephalus microplus]